VWAAARGRLRPETIGRIGMGCIGTSVLLMVTTAFLGPSSTEFALGRTDDGPPWYVTAHPTGTTVAVLQLVTVFGGALGIWLELVAMRRGWRPSWRKLFAFGVISTIALLAVPATTSTDIVDYAAYGRIAAIGHSPYVETPKMLAASGDPVGKVANEIKFYHRVPTVYGPIATGAEWAAAEAGGRSTRRIVWWLDVEAGVAFIVTGALAGAIAGPDPVARARSQLLWSANPLLLLELVGGGHTDVIAVAIGMAALLALRRTRFGSGAAAMAAAATKATAALFGVAVVWAQRRSPRALATTVLGAAALGIPAYLIAGHGTFTVLDQRAGGLTRADMWHPLFLVLQSHRGIRFAHDTISLLSGVSALALFVLLARRLPAAPQGGELGVAVRTALVIAVAWTFTGAYYLPWYDAMVWSLIAVVAATWLDVIVLLHTTAMALSYLPGVGGIGPGFLETTHHLARTHYVPAFLLALALFVAVRSAYAPAGARISGH
jgi:hypothetical protein